jgi:hypothetical protein
MLVHNTLLDVQRLLKKRAETSQYEDPERVLADFYAVLARLPTEYKRLTPANRKRMAQQVIKDIRLNILSTQLFLLHVEWQNGITICPDVALIWRGVSPNTAREWTAEEDAALVEYYPSAPQVEVMQALPNRAWNRILERAQNLGLRRKITHAGPHPFNLYHRTMSYRDLDAAACLVDDPQQQERLRQVANELAKRTVRGGLSAHWWLPLEIISYAGGAPGQNGADTSLLYVNAVAYESRRRGGSSRR